MKAVPVRLYNVYGGTSTFPAHVVVARLHPAALPVRVLDLHPPAASWRRGARSRRAGGWAARRLRQQVLRPAAVRRVRRRRRPPPALAPAHAPTPARPRPQVGERLLLLVVLPALLHDGRGGEGERLLLVMCLVVNLAFSAMHVYSLVAILVCDGGSCRFRRKGSTRSVPPCGLTRAAAPTRRSTRGMVIAVVEVDRSCCSGGRRSTCGATLGGAVRRRGERPAQARAFGTFFQPAFMASRRTAHHPAGDRQPTRAVRGGGPAVRRLEFGLAAQQVEELVVGLCGMCGRAPPRAPSCTSGGARTFVPLGALYPVLPLVEVVRVRPAVRRMGGRQRRGCSRGCGRR